MEGFGYIKTYIGDYEDSPENDRATDNKNIYEMLTDSSDVHIYEKLKSASNKIEEKCFAYKPAVPNSNSYTMSVEKYAGLEPKTPGWWAPGWGIDLLKGERR